MAISSFLGSSALLPAGLGFRNKIINGDMRINQRATTYTGTASIQYTLDRYYFYASSGTVTVSQSTNVPTGFSTSLYVNVVSGGTYSSGGNYCLLGQIIEAGGITDLSWGSSSAQTITVSFWVKSSITGTYSFAIQNHGYQNSAYVATYTIDSANTWEYKTVRILGSTTGTWNGCSNTSYSSGGMIVGFSLGVDTNFQTESPNTWITSNRYGTPATVDLAATTGASFYLTGLQVERNHQPTPFETRPHHVELNMCKRYFWRCIDPAGVGVNNAASQSTRTLIPFHTEMRSAPTTSVSGTFNFWNGNVTGTGTALIGSFNSRNHGQVDFNGGAGAHTGCVTLYTTGGSQYLDFSAEYV